MRGVIMLILVVFTMIIFTLFAPAAIEGVGEFVIQQDSVDQQGQDTVQSMYQTIFVYIPLILVFGLGVVWPIAWYLRKQLDTGEF